jgi:hypothetical protein
MATPRKPVPPVTRNTSPVFSLCCGEEDGTALVVVLDDSELLLLLLDFSAIM